MTTLTLDVRSLQPADMPAVRRIDSNHADEPRGVFWTRVAQVFFEGTDDDRFRIALALETPEEPGQLAGFLLGEVRAFEFGSDACGWIFAVGVDPAGTRQGVASALLDEAYVRFAAAGVSKVRTMVLREDVPVLAFFRSNGFVGGSFVQLEVDLTDRPRSAPSTENAA